jgi:hypothetical protein
MLKIGLSEEILSISISATLLAFRLFIISALIDELPQLITSIFIEIISVIYFNRKNGHF